MRCSWQNQVPSTKADSGSTSSTAMEKTLIRDCDNRYAGKFERGLPHGSGERLNPVRNLNFLG